MGWRNHKTRYLVSACLAGCSTNLCGSTSRNDTVADWHRRGLAVAVCPEQLGGLSTPRPAAEIRGGSGSDVITGSARVASIDGNDVTEQFTRGAKATLEIARVIKPDFVVLKERSPSCGVHRIYDGSFSGTISEGCHGVTAGLLMKEGFIVLSEDDI